MIKKRSRPATVRERPAEDETAVTAPVDAAVDPEAAEDAGEAALDVADLLELRRLKRAHSGIDVNKLRVGDTRKRRKLNPDDANSLGTISQSGLREVAREAGDEELEGDEAKARRAVRANNFTQQTNALDVDKHMMKYIEESMRERHGKRPGDPSSDDEGEGKKKVDTWDPEAELYRVDPIFPSKEREEAAKKEQQRENEKARERKERERKEAEEAKRKKASEDGSVTNSLAMLTAIPEVDLGMDTRLKNIEETEKAKRTAADARSNRPWIDRDDLVAGRFYRGQDRSKMQTDDQRLQKAIAVEMGQAPDPNKRREHQEGRNNHHNNNRKEMATDDIAMERFKKRMASQRK